MFQNKNTGNTQETSQFPIHTMQKDLEEINNPSLHKEPVQDDYAPPAPKNLTAVQKSSPFLNPASAPTDIQPSNMPPIKDDAGVIAEKSGNSANYKLLLLIFSVLIILVIAGGGGYYFWITRQQPQEIIPAEETPAANVEIPAEETVVPPENPQPEIIQPVAQFSTDKPNYLNIDIANSDSVKIQEVLKKYAQDVAQTGTLTPVEFVVTDLQNNPITLATFTTQAGIDISSTLLLNSNDTFSLFIYTDQGGARLALAIDSKNDSQLKTSMRTEEANLATEIAPLFLDVPHTISAGVFADSTYKNAAVRYRNIVSPSELSIDYAIYNKKLIIATTKMTLRSVIDYIERTALSQSTSVTSGGTPPVTLGGSVLPQ